MTNDMTKGSPLKLILLFTVPVLLGNIFQQLYNMVDTIIVGHFINYQALAAVGSTGSIGFLILGFVMGLTGGFAVVTAQRFGAKDEDGLRHSVAMILYLCIAASVIITIVSLLVVTPLLRLMNTPDDIFADARTYITIIFIGTAANLAYNMFACLLRALGDSKTPLYFLIFSSILNIGLDLLFIAVFQMGVAGAAWATIIAQAVSALLCFFYTKKKFPILRLTKRDFRWDWPFAWRHLSLGFPMAFQFSITAIGTIILQSALNLFGSVKIAAFTAANKVEQLVSQPSNSFGITMANYAGQNLGANNLDRVKEGTKKCIILSLAFCVVSSLILFLFAEPLTQLFISNTKKEIVEDIFSGAKTYLYLAAAFYPFLSLLFIFRNVLQGMGKSFWPMMAGVAELVFRSIVAFTLPGIMGYTGICLASPAAWVGASILLVLSYIFTMRKMQKRWNRPAAPAASQR